MTSTAAQSALMTERLCAFLSDARIDDLGAPARHAARRAMMDFLGCCLAGSADHESRKLLALLRSLDGEGAVAALGTQQRLGLLDAALFNGFSAHVLDYDDTRSTTPIYAALLSLVQQRTRSGPEVLLAYAVGMEAGQRILRATPRHHRAGWHPIGTVGTLAAAVAAAKLLNLDAQTMQHAVGLAVAQAAGVQQNRSTSCKPLHASKAAANGLIAALLAEQGFDSSPLSLEGKTGFLNLFSSEVDPAQLVAGLGEGWDVMRNGYKPYACGLVLHPLIDGMIALRAQCGAAADIMRIDIRCHPLVMTVAANSSPQTGTQSRFSAAHAAAVAFLDGAAGVAQFTDARVHAGEVARLRERVALTPDTTLADDAAIVTVTLASGCVEAKIDHATGSIHRPMTDEALAQKFTANAAPVIGEARAAQALALMADLDDLPDICVLIALCKPA